MPRNNKRPCILLTGFGPFPGAPVNPSEALVNKLVGTRHRSLKLVGHIFQTSYRAVDRDLPLLIARVRPDAILMFGLAARARKIRIETQACNALAALPDATGRVPRKTIIARNGPRRLPIRADRHALLEAAQRGRIPARLSRDAGSYLCNYLYWHALQAKGPRLAAFVHVPNSDMADLYTSGKALLRALVAQLHKSV